MLLRMGCDDILHNDCGKPNKWQLANASRVCLLQCYAKPATPNCVRGEVDVTIACLSAYLCRNHAYYAVVNGKS